METRVSELMRVDQLISSLMARLRQANKEKRDRCRKINNDIAITVTCQLDLEAAISLKKSKRDWNPKRFLVRSEEPDYADSVRENRRMKRMASRSHLKRTTSPPSWMPILRSSPGASGFHASRCYQGIDKYHVGARISVGCSANGGVEGRPPDSHSAGGWSRSCNRDL
ncbi:unnamed protein product [Prunus armeniaca]|uniref:Uncharacterized protein n=1 Tax=Prunus armeniaca TaxID=36596 RepID=A0A6J5Y9D3_PRUAR|nr:unnamed protein product [Prunus armeniaca]